MKTNELLIVVAAMTAIIITNTIIDGIKRIRREKYDREIKMVQKEEA